MGDANRTSATPGRSAWGPRLRIGIASLDAAVIALVMSLAYAFRFDFGTRVGVSGPFAPSYTLASVAIGLGWWYALGATGSRDIGILGHGPQELQRLMSATWRCFAVVAIIGFSTQWAVSRAFLLAALVFGVPLLLGGRAILRLAIHRERDNDRLQANVVVVGSPASVTELVSRFRGGRRAGFRVVAVAEMPGISRKAPVGIGDLIHLGELVDPVKQAAEVGADYIVVAGSDTLSFAESRKLGWALEGTNIGLLVAPSLADVAGPRVKMAPVAGLPLLHVTSPAFTGVRYVVKAALDRVGGVLLLVLSALPMLVIALLVRVDSPGPAVFVQERVGLGMKPFRMYKFRSMYVDSEERLEELLDLNDGDGALFKMKRDPRVTPVGAFLRRFSLDELPQLFNVIKGDMSLVGPRPPLAREVELWEADVERRQLVKPGLTGLWQVSGRSDLSWEESVRLDLYYADNWTFGGDVVIMLRTIYSIVRSRGAY